MDELERLAGVGPSGAPKTVEMDSVERLMSKGHPAVLLRSAEVRCPPQKALPPLISEPRRGPSELSGRESMPKSIV